MKSLNENLREEFREILSSIEIREMISNHNLKREIIDDAFEKLLSNKYLKDDDVSKGKTEFQNMIINSLKDKK